MISPTLKQFSLTYWFRCSIRSTAQRIRSSRRFSRNSSRTLRRSASSAVRCSWTHSASLCTAHSDKSMVLTTKRCTKSKPMLKTRSRSRVLRRSKPSRSRRRTTLTLSLMLTTRSWTNAVMTLISKRRRCLLSRFWEILMLYEQLRSCSASFRGGRSTRHRCTASNWKLNWL